MIYNDETHKLDLWITSDEGVYDRAKSELEGIAKGAEYSDLTYAQQNECDAALRLLVEDTYGTSDLLPAGWAREMLDNAYAQVEWSDLTATYVDLLAEDN